MIDQSNRYSQRDHLPKNLNSVIIYSPSSCSKPVFYLFFNLSLFFRSVEHKKLMADFQSMEKNTMYYVLCNSMATVSCLVTNILQNIFFCAQQKKAIQVWNNLCVSK